jgi:hypothetical protein
MNMSQHAESAPLYYPKPALRDNACFNNGFPGLMFTLYRDTVTVLSVGVEKSKRDPKI